MDYHQWSLDPEKYGVPSGSRTEYLTSISEPSQLSPVEQYLLNMIAGKYLLGCKKKISRNKNLESDEILYCFDAKTQGIYLSVKSFIREKEINLAFGIYVDPLAQGSDLVADRDLLVESNIWKGDVLGNFSLDFEVDDHGFKVTVLNYVAYGSKSIIPGKIYGYIDDSTMLLSILY